MSKLIKKCDDILERLRGITHTTLPEQMEKAIASGWSHDVKSPNEIHFLHGEHHPVSVIKTPEGKFHVKQAGAIAGLKGVKGEFDNPKDALTHAMSYLSAINAGTVTPKGMMNISSGSVPNTMQKPQKVGGIEIPASTPNFTANKPGFGGQIANPKTMNTPVPAFGPKPIAKSNTGPKGTYDSIANIQRKMKRTGDEIDGIGGNKAVKQYNARAGGMSPAQTEAANKKKARAMRGPVKTFSPEEIAAEQTKSEAAGKNKLARSQEEVATADMLAKFLKLDGTNHTPAPSSNWMQEACKPINQGLTPEEQEAYWASIKVDPRLYGAD